MILGVGYLRDDDMLRLTLDCARRAVTGMPYKAVLAAGVQRLLRADAGAGVTTWSAAAGGVTEVVVAGVAPLTDAEIIAARSVMARHPTFNGPNSFVTPTHRVSDFVSLPEFWDTDVWHAMHSRGNGRFPAAVSLSRLRSATVFAGVHRTGHDFDADDMATLDLLREPLTSAIAFRTSWDAAIQRCRPASRDDPLREALTPREEQILGLVALGWTNARIGRHLHITERTVRKHLENINDKLGTSNRAAAVSRWHDPRYDR